MKRLSAKLTYSNVVSTLCLVLLLGGGTAYAASSLGKESVGSRQLKKEAVTPAKLSKASKATLTGPAGPAGEKGATGAQGPKGDNGARGLEGAPGKPATAMWGLVGENGTLSHGSEVTATKLLGTGEYEVVFPRDLTQCTWQVTLDGDHLGLVATEIRAGNNDAVFVKTTNPAGTITTSSPFDIAVFC